MGKYRLLFLVVSCVLWAGILYGVSKVRPHLMAFDPFNENVVKADKEKKDKPPPPPPPPPPPDKLPPPPPIILDRKTPPIEGIPPPPIQDERIVVEEPPPPPKPVEIQPTEYTAPPAPPPPPPPPPSCTEAPRAAQRTRPFNIDRAYPPRAVENGIEGRVTATLSIDASGEVVGVTINSSTSSIFDGAVQREARRMRYTPARRNCENIPTTVPLDVQFRLDGG